MMDKLVADRAYLAKRLEEALDDIERIRRQRDSYKRELILMGRYKATDAAIRLKQENSGLEGAIRSLLSHRTDLAPADIDDFIEKARDGRR